MGCHPLAAEYVQLSHARCRQRRGGWHLGIDFAGQHAAAQVRVVGVLQVERQRPVLGLVLGCDAAAVLEQRDLHLRRHRPCTKLSIIQE